MAVCQKTYANTSVVVIGRPEVFRSGKSADELGGIVNQDWQMLRTNPQRRATVVQGDERCQMVFSLAG